MASNKKNVISVDIKNVGQGRHLLKSFYFCYHMTNFNQTFNKMVHLGLVINVSSADSENVGQGHILERVIAQLL